MNNTIKHDNNTNNDININNSVGLLNFGNTCFMNSGIQLIMSAPDLCQHFLNNEKLMNTKLKKYIKTIADYMNVTTNTLGPKILYTSYKKLNTRYHGLSQEDAREFLTYTLDDIVTNIRELEKPQFSQYIENTESLLTYVLETKVTKKNSTESPSIISYREVLLPLPLPLENLTLENCYKNFTLEDDEEKVIEYSLKNLLKYLYVAVKRFQCDGKRISKRQENVEIPFLTDMFGPIYLLKGFIVHMGSMNSGHYVTYASRTIDSKTTWYLYNDNSVTEISAETIEQKSKIAYVFLYVKS